MTSSTTSTMIKNRKNPKDVFITPKELARTGIDMIEFRSDEVWYDPFRNSGSYFNQFPYDELMEIFPQFTHAWSEILEGKDFFDYKTQVDVICSNPPYSMIDKVLEHSVELKPRVIQYLLGVGNLTAKRIEFMENAGYGITKFHMCKVFKWYGMSAIVTWEKGGTGIFSYDRKVWRNEKDKKKTKKTKKNKKIKRSGNWKQTKTGWIIEKKKTKAKEEKKLKVENFKITPSILPPEAVEGIAAPVILKFHEDMEVIFEEIDEDKFNKVGIKRLHNWYKAQYGRRITNASKNIFQARKLIIKRIMSDEERCKRKDKLISLNELINEKRKVKKNNKDFTKYKVGDEVIHTFPKKHTAGIITKVNKASIRFKPYKFGLKTYPQGAVNHYYDKDNFEKEKTVRANFYTIDEVEDWCKYKFEYFLYTFL
jgi:hypothetical protein